MPEVYGTNIPNVFRYYGKGNHMGKHIVYTAIIKANEQANAELFRHQDSDNGGEIANPKPSYCDICFDTAHWYMLNNIIWQQVVLFYNNFDDIRYICLVCVEYALDRELTIEDFTMTPKE
jgi:hypothetical protein